MNNNNGNMNKMDGLINVIAKKLNVKPDQLKKELQEGKFDSALKNMNRSDAEKFNAAVNNPKIAEQMMSSPQAQALYKKLSGEK